MNGYIAGPFQVVLGTHLFTVEIYVAPIEEDVLLGLDFLEANGVSLHLKEKELQISGDVITVTAPSSSSSVAQFPILSSTPFSSSSMDSSVSLLSLLFSSPTDSSLENSYPRLAPSDLTRPSGPLESGGSSSISLVVRRDGSNVKVRIRGMSPQVISQ
jgi:hypothetical protein